MMVQQNPQMLQQVLRGGAGGRSLPDDQSLQVTNVSSSCQDLSFNIRVAVAIRCRQTRLYISCHNRVDLAQARCY